VLHQRPAVAVIELKNPANEQADIWAAFNQLQTYKDEIADLFVNNEALVISDGLHARIGSLTANRERFLPWRTLKNENDRPLLEFELEKVVRGFFAPELLLDYLRYFVLFETAEGQTVKKIAGYHQFHAVRAAVKAAVIAATQPAATLAQEQWATYADRVKPGSRMGGIVWHTQGSGKSISMVCFAAKLMQQKEMQNPTLVVVTDRNDLDGQLFQTFVGARSLLRETPQQATNRDQLARAAGGAALGRHHFHHGAEVRARGPTKRCFRCSPIAPTSWSLPTRPTARSTAFAPCWTRRPANTSTALPSICATR
jgi:type I restriction enzyme R subunit